jgi:predicted transcriptional regulator
MREMIANRAEIHFGKWLKRQIENLPMTQTEFARHCGIPLPTLGTWIYQPNARLRGDNIVRVARALGISREELESHFRTESSMKSVA